jgi:hypothetical protein
MERESFIVLNKVIPIYRIVGVRHNDRDESIVEDPRSVRRTRSCEYFKEKLGAEMAHHPQISYGIFRFAE